MIPPKIDPTDDLKPFDSGTHAALNSTPISPSKRRHSPVKYPVLASIRHNNAKLAFQRAAFEMTVEKEDDSVQSSDYYINPFLGDKRERKFKTQTLNAKQDPEIKRLVEQKKVLKNELLTNASNNQKQHIIDLLLYYAKKETPFEDLPAYFCKGLAPEELKSAYSDLKNGKKINLPDAFTDLIDFRTMSYAQIFCELDYHQKIHFAIKQVKSMLHDDHKNAECLIKLEMETDPKVIRLLVDDLKNYIKDFKLNSVKIDDQIKQLYATLDKLPENDWSTKDPIIEVFEKYWNSEITTLNKSTQLLNKSIKEYLLGFGFEIPVQPNAFFNTFPQLITGKTNAKLLGQMIGAVTNRVRQNIPTPESQELLFTNFKARCESDWSTYFEMLVRTAKKNPAISLDVLLKEQRQHSLVRFNNLFNYYTAFLNTVTNLGNLGESKYGAKFKENAHAVVASLLENSYIELKSDKDSSKKSTDIAKLEKLVTIDLDYHRIKSIMGYEKVKMDKEKKKEIINSLNLALGPSEKGKLILDLQRSHSLQFPSVFAWKKLKLIEFINQKFNANLDEKLESGDTFFSRDFFKSIKTEVLAHKQIEELFSNEFGKILTKTESQEMFLFMSLELIRKFYIRLFSETQLFPDFINQYADGASEWREKGVKGENYKKSIAGILTNLVKSQKEYDKSDTIQALKPYLEKTVIELDRLNKKLETKSTNSLFKKVCYAQVEESMRIAMSGNVQPHFIEEIFKQNQSVTDPSNLIKV